MSLLKSILLKPLCLSGVTETLAALAGVQATIFMLHRFADPEYGVHGHNPEILRQVLACLRKRRYDLVSVREMFRRLSENVPMKQAVAFTIDDGYYDHARVGEPIFSEFDCPVTTFVVTGFLDGKIWFWWDKLKYIFEKASKGMLKIAIGAETISFEIDSPASRATACSDLSDRLTGLSEEARLECVEQLSRETAVYLPALPPPQFAPLTWNEAHRLEHGVMTFGPHTVTHPILSTTSSQQADFEIRESWRRLSVELERPVPVFCYPNGKLRDFGNREIEILRSLKMWGAVTGDPGTLQAKQFRATDTAPFFVPRYGYWDSLPHVLQAVSGLEGMKTRLRQSLG